MHTNTTHTHTHTKRMTAKNTMPVLARQFATQLIVTGKKTPKNSSKQKVQSTMLRTTSKLQASAAQIRRRQRVRPLTVSLTGRNSQEI